MKLIQTECLYVLSCRFAVSLGAAMDNCLHHMSAALCCSLLCVKWAATCTVRNNMLAVFGHAQLKLN